MTQQVRWAGAADISAPIRGESALRMLLFLVAALPAIYCFIAIQFSAITVPFWDHTELIHWIAAWYDGNFSFSSLWEPHNHTRPLVYRIIMLFNAVLTDWDIRSEYIYIYMALYGTFACHIWALRRVTAGEVHGMVYPLALILVSLILFSPVGHNNHWWSMMFQLNAANLFIAFGLLVSFIRPHRWSSHVFAAASCWLAVYSLTNGFFAVLAIGLVFQLSAAQLLRPSRWTLFWVGNLLALLLCYLPGLTLSTSSVHPTLLQLTQFSLAYLGAALGGLIWFPFPTMFDIPLHILPNAICGTLLLSSYTALCWHGRGRLRDQQSAALILYGFGIFAIISALATGWGRAAFDDYGVAAGNSSRYTIFGAYLMLGQLYYVAAGFAHGWWSDQVPLRRLPRYVVIIVTTFVLLSMFNYGRAVNVYINAHSFNKKLFDAYPWGLQATPEDKNIHPNPESVNRLKRDLQRLELGPYSNRPFKQIVLDIGRFSKAGLLSGGRKISQRFTATEDGLKAVGITLETPNGMQTMGTIEWDVTEIGENQPLASGKLDVNRINGGETVRLRLPYLGASKGREYQLTLSAIADDAHGLGVSLYTPVAGHTEILTIHEESGSSKTESLLMALRIEYAK